MRRGYEFPLENVLKYRKIKKDQQNAAFRESKARLQVLTEQRDSCLEKIRELEDQIGLMEAGRNIDIKNMKIKKAFLETLRKKEEKLRDLCLEAEEELDRERMCLIECSRDAKVIVKMKERGYKKYLFDVQKKDAKKVDDIMLCRHHTKMERSETI